jgi:protein-S-isoprenylcysteine O-methyltransferase Ste14
MSFMDVVSSRVGQIVTNALLASLWFLFAVRHLAAFRETGAVDVLVFGLSESALVVMYVLRKPTTNVASDWMPWALAIGGTFLPMFFTPSHVVLFQPGTLLVVVGAFLMLGGVLSLNRSFGIVAAQRDIKTGGLYQVVRHPIYLSYVFSFSGYVLGNWSPQNFAVYAVSLALMVARLHQEEKLLSKDPEYREFMARTPYRLVPFVW